MEILNTDTTSFFPLLLLRYKLCAISIAPICYSCSLGLVLLFTLLINWFSFCCGTFWSHLLPAKYHHSCPIKLNNYIEVNLFFYYNGLKELVLPRLWWGRVVVLSFSLSLLFVFLFHYHHHDHVHRHFKLLVSVLILFYLWSSQNSWESGHIQMWQINIWKLFCDLIIKAWELDITIYLILKNLLYYNNTHLPSTYVISFQQQWMVKPHFSAMLIVLTKNA